MTAESRHCEERWGVISFRPVNSSSFAVVVRASSFVRAANQGGEYASFLGNYVDGDGDDEELQQ